MDSTYFMSEYKSLGPEQSPHSAEQISNSIQQAHREFLSLAPGYAQGAWNPIEAVNTGKGSCMAELLYVAGKLIHNGDVGEADINIGFAIDHGQQVDNRFGRPTRKYAHTTAFITTKDGTVEVDFRAHRADERPLVRMLNGESVHDDRYYIGTLEDAVERYAVAVGDELVSVADIINLHNNEKPSTDTHEDVRFDEEF